MGFKKLPGERREFTDDKLGMTLVVETKPQNVDSGSQEIPALGLSVAITASGEEARRKLAIAAKLPDIKSFISEGGDISLIYINPIEREAGMVPSFDKVKNALDSTGLIFSSEILAQARAAYMEMSKQPYTRRL